MTGVTDHDPVCAAAGGACICLALQPRMRHARVVERERCVLEIEADARRVADLPGQHSATIAALMHAARLLRSGGGE